jgi:hypothetical protein
MSEESLGEGVTIHDLKGYRDRARCPVCDWPMASSPEKGCVPGDCCYRPGDPAEQRRISERRKALAAQS